MSGPTPALARLVVAYESADALRANHMASAYDTFVVDNASRDGTRDVAAALGYRVLALAQNHGYGRAIMHALAHMDADLVFIANPDVRASDDTLAALVDAAQRYPDADLFVPRLLRDDGSEFFRHADRFEAGVRDRAIPEGDACIRTLSGAALLVRRASFLTHGFDPNIFLYFEDDDLARGYAKAKRPIVFVAAAQARHAGDSSSAPSREIEALKSLSFGWSLGYVLTKHRLGILRREIAGACVKCAGAVLTLRFGRARRMWLVLRGLMRFASGRPAPALPAHMPELDGRG